MKWILVSLAAIFVICGSMAIATIALPFFYGWPHAEYICEYDYSGAKEVECLAFHAKISQIWYAFAVIGLVGIGLLFTMVIGSMVDFVRRD